MTPQVSIIMPFWNAEPYLGEAIQSVQAQTGVAWELWLVNDASDDSSRDLAVAFAESDSRIRLLEDPHGRRLGASAARNFALDRAASPLVALLDADDVWLPGALRQQVEILELHPEVAMAYANAERWLDFQIPYDGEAGSKGHNYLPPLLPAGVAPGLVTPPSLLDWFLSDESLTPCTCTVLVRTEAARRVGGFENEFEGVYDDQVFYAKVALHYNIWANPVCLARYRKHSTSLCATSSEPGRAAFLSWLDSYRKAHP